MLAVKSLLKDNDNMLLDEYQIAEQIISSKRFSKNEELFILAKYLRNEMNCDENDTYSILEDIIIRSAPKKNTAKMKKYLIKISKKAKDYKLLKIDNVNITKKELNTISTVASPKLQRLLFSLLVNAKFRNKISENNHDWCNIKINDLYKAARVSTRNSKEKALLLFNLKNLGLITFSLKNTNHNIRCLFVDEEKHEDDVIISDLRELGYQYLKIIGENSFIECQECGILIKRKNKNDFSTKCCPSCIRVKNYERKRNSFHKLDKA